MSDLIERQKVIDALELGLDNDYVDATEFLGYVRSLPSAEPERKWISTADRLPENNQRVLVSIIRSDGAKRVRTGSYSSNEYFWIDNGDYWKAKKVQAWMPLPEPWKGQK